ncbi:toxin-antitoxin system YwqK family antitoxin [Flagellimonas sp.]|uniref:toxin-antitoxin system YwqK family antitoxin n=1 Tax=Flagellimonas sp. TaxID=2058762 RepID=UPI003B5A8861
MSFSQEIIKALQVPSIKLVSVCTLCLLFIESCSQNHTRKRYIKQTEVPKSELKLDQTAGRWYYLNLPFDGYAVEYHKNGILATKTGYSQGKKEGIAKKWFNSGVLRAQMVYNANKLDGTSRSWWPNGVLSTESTYVMGIRNGVQKKWYPNGQLARKTHLNNGFEEGLQQAWLKTGKLYANYEAKNGRFFGLKRSNLCYELKDEVVQR